MGLRVPFVTKIAPHSVRHHGTRRRQRTTPSPRRPLIQCPAVVHVSGSACRTRGITGIWTNIRQIRPALVIVTIVQRPGERAGEWDKGGHLRVITAQRFGDRIQLMGSNVEQRERKKDVTCVRTWGQSKCAASTRLMLPLAIRDHFLALKLMPSHLQKS